MLNTIRIAAAATVAACVAPGLAQTVVTDAGPGVWRYDQNASKKSGAKPSLSLLNPAPDFGPATPGSVVPAFASLGGNSTRIEIDAPFGTSLYGTGLVAGPLERTGRTTTLWNDDNYAWGDWAESLYESHPWVLGVLPDGTAFGAVFDTPHRMTIDTTGDSGVSVRVTAETDNVPVYVIEASTPQQVVRTLADLTGTPFMPPLWSLGYHQSRYSYTPDWRVLQVAQEFRNRSIPGDTIWLDIDYMDGYRMFTWDPSAFPNPPALDASLEAIGFSTIAIVDPHIKVDPGYWVYDSGNANDVWVKWADQTTDFVGPVWPGDSKFPDFTRADVRAWWGAFYGPFLNDNGIEGVWNDMNEPAVFLDQYGWTMPEDNWHRADADVGGPASHRRYHNVYGMLMARGTYEGFQAARPGTRPFVLTRANHLGGHRYAATWTGDNVSDWYHLDVSIPNVLNLGLSGQPNTGPDIGGFAGSGDAQQFARWMGFGALLPFARGHTGVGNPDKEPWSYGPDTEHTARLALQRRYRLLPHYYTLFKEAHDTGMPVARPLFFADPANPNLRTIDNMFMLGDSLVVSVNTQPGDALPIRPPLDEDLVQFGFPQDDLGLAGSDLCEDDLPSLFLRPGHIVPTGPILQHTGDGYLSELVLLVALDENGQASGTLYEDAGDGYGYLAGDYLETTYAASEQDGQVIVSVQSEQGSRARPVRPITVRLLLADGVEIQAAGVDGQPIALTLPGTLPDPVSCDGGAVNPPEFIDGRRIDEAFAGALATQTNPTNLGDNVSELNQLYAELDETGLRLGLTGNLATDGTALAVFLDTGPGGQGVLDTSTQPSPPSGLANMTGLTFDTGFRPDLMYFINAYAGGIYVDRLTLTDGAPASKAYLGAGAVGSGQGVLDQSDTLVAIDNSNILGVTNTSAANADNATFGAELLIPASDLALPSPDGPVSVMAVIVRSYGELSQQILPPLVPGQSNPLGFSPNLNLFFGDQFVQVTTPCAADVNADGVLDNGDIGAFVALFLAGDPAADFTGDGILDNGDIGAFVAEFLAGCSS
ncbi:MAG: TIM-barrel domain-containing protein [Phycisphaerales bacterium JB040]